MSIMPTRLTDVSHIPLSTDNEAALWAIAAVVIGAEVTALAYAIFHHTAAGERSRKRALSRRLDRARAARRKACAGQPVGFYPLPDLADELDQDEIDVPAPTPAPRLQAPERSTAQAYPGWELTGGRPVPYPEPCTVILVGGQPSSYAGGDEGEQHYLAASDLENLGRDLMALQEQESARFVWDGTRPRTIELARMAIACVHISCAECAAVAGDDEGPWHLDPAQLTQWLIGWGWRRRAELGEAWVCEQCARPQDAPLTPTPGQTELPVLAAVPAARVGGAL